jgi:hypothetical protein
MDFYHGSVKKGLTVLKPFAQKNTDIKEPCVFLTLNKQLALFYIWDLNRFPFKVPLLDVRKDGVIVFQEMCSGALEYLYKGLSGYIYHCIGSYELNPSFSINSVALSKNEVEIKDCEFIEDVYERIIEYGKYGLFINEKYEELPQYKHDIIRGWVMRWIKAENCIKDKDSFLSKFYQDRYPTYWKEAEILDRNNLL